MPQDAIILDKSSRFHSFYGQGPDATLDMEVMLYFCCVCNQIYIFNNALQPLVMAVKSTFGGLIQLQRREGRWSGQKTDRRSNNGVGGKASQLGRVVRLVA